MQDSAVTLPKLGADVKSIAGTAYALVPRGSILMWGGTFGGTGNKNPMIGGAPNTAWHICDGTDGTPDLRNKFIVGAGNTYAVGATGGASTHTHGATGLVSPSHMHANPHTHSYNYRHAHSHTFSATTGAGSTQGDAAAGEYGVNLNTHTHNVSGTTSTDSTLSKQTGGPSIGETSGTAATITGSTAAGSTMPPYYALAFIQRI
jgi:hypothetical protein